jgi:hypothetical protein
MSDSEQDASVLGKRTRNGNGPSDVDIPESAPPTNEEDEDEDVGPMPMSEAAAVNGGSKKKRKGVYTAICLLWDLMSDGLESIASRTGTFHRGRHVLPPIL